MHIKQLVVNTPLASIIDGPKYQRSCSTHYLGVTPYELALKRQRLLASARYEGSITDVILLLQHPPIFTIGRFGSDGDIIVPGNRLRREGISVFRTDRGGGVTYHGPGQLVCYPIISLRENNLDIRRYIHLLESAVIKLLLSLDIHGQRVNQRHGVWIHGKKVCSIGVHVSHGITMHGLALNVNPDLGYFGYIKPCGIGGDMITSISELLGESLAPEAILETFLDCFSATFSLSCHWGDNDARY
jgi:lipoate-protein ligase B